MDDPRSFPTKGNLIAARNSLALARQGYELMDRKRNILLRELMGLISQAETIQNEIDATYSAAYAALQRANIDLGISQVNQIARTVPVENSVRLKSRSIMGTEIPLAEYDRKPPKPTYSFFTTRQTLDAAMTEFYKVKDLTVRLATVENSAYRLAESIRKTQKRANALKNITIPRYEQLVKSISNALEEKDREEFTRLKVIKRQKQEKEARG